VAGKDTNIGAKRARELRAELGLAPEGAVGSLLAVTEERLGLPVVVAALPDDIAGCCWRDGDRTLLWVNGTHAPVRMRFTLAHELGHMRCGHDARVAVDTYATLAGRSTDAREVQANAFAAELLAPAAGVRAMLDGEPTLEDVVRIAARHGISAMAALFRLSTLGLSRRVDALRGEIDDGLVADVWRRLAPAPYEDELAAIGRGDLPRLSPVIAGGALGAIVAGRASIGDAASAADCPPERLASGAATIGV
jgi:Zn-dependent peptidase ImmA (M78 family)